MTLPLNPSRKLNPPFFHVNNDFLCDARVGVENRLPNPIFLHRLSPGLNVRTFQTFSLTLSGPTYRRNLLGYYHRSSDVRMLVAQSLDHTHNDQI